MAQPIVLRRLLPKPESETQSEFSLKPTRPGTAPASATSTTSREFSRRSLGQKRRREREAQEMLWYASASSSSRRSLAQQARRQRELAAAMERELTGAESNANVRSNAQKFRRQVEAAERRLDIAPNCDSSEALARILDFNVDNFGRFRRESYRDRMRRLYRPGY
ncbi:hypothetical protein C8R46DRAFT_1111577 [Mycena filopes]|nr:hypothetical protein C8R46DRAFT_1111577 [Mycena filopes]